MNLLLDENSTRKNIILLLKKSGGMSIDELSKVIDITPMGIRQHLLALEKKGMVTYVSRKRGIGRPGFVYMLTDSADNLFPKSYDNFSLGILRDIKKYDGQGKIDKIFGWRRERLVKLWKEALSGKESLDDKLQSLKQMLESEGYIIEVSKNNKHYHLIQYHCPIHKIASEFKEACSNELQLYRDLIDKNIIRERSIAETSPSCHYLIPKT